MALPIYSTGTVSVAVGGTVVTNVGGLWSGINVKQGDFISINGLPAVLITEVTDTTHLQIPPWGGAAQSGVAYVIYQNYVGRVVGVAAAEDVGDMLERLRDQAPIYNVPAGETEPDPSYGSDGQWAYQVETNTWWVKDAGDWVLMDGPPIGGGAVGSVSDVTSRAVMKTVDLTTVKTVFLHESGREGLFAWTVGDFTTRHAADTAESVYVKADSAASSTGSWVRQRDKLDWFVNWFGAKGDGTTDDQAAIQAAFNMAVAFGGDVRLRRGQYIVASPLTVALPDVAIYSSQHFRFTGEGGALSIIRYSGTGQMLTISGPTWGSAGVSCKLRLEGITFDGVALTADGLKIERVIDLALTDVHFIQFDLAHELRDIVVANYYSCTWSFNVSGLQALTSTSSAPNELNFHGCTFSSNRAHGAFFYRSAPVSFFGGSIEANGHTGSWTAIDPTLRFGIQMYDCGTNGATPLNMYGVHTEGNSGTADVVISHDNYSSCVYNICGVDFFHTGPTENVTHNVSVNATANGTCTVNINGCGFNHVGGYVPDAAKRRVQNYGDLTKARINIDPSCRFSSTVDTPDVSCRVYSIKSAATASLTVATPSATILSAHNIASVVHSATGQYTIAFKCPMELADFVVVGTVAAGAGFVVVGGRATTGVVLQTVNLSGVLADVGTELHMQVTGGVGW